MALAPKTYYVEDDERDDFKRSSKGIPKKVKLTAEEYCDVLFNKNDHKVQYESLRLSHDKKTMQHTTLTKTGLSNVCLKVRVEDDGITCGPLTKNGEYI